VRIHGALVREQGITFGVLAVKPAVLSSALRRDETLRSAHVIFPGVPVVLMAQDSRGIPKYYGRRDIVRFLAAVPFEAIPWREYTLN
jgi:hypothetical protein